MVSAYYRTWDTTLLWIFYSVVLLGLVGIGDGIVAKNLITATGPDTKLYAALTYLSFGSLIGLFVYTAIYHYKWWSVPPSSALRRTPPAPLRLHFYCVLSGIATSLAILLRLYALQSYDPGMVAALTQGAVLFIAIHEVLKKEVSVTEILAPSAALIVGVLLISASSIDDIAWEAIVIVFLGTNLLRTVEAHYTQKSARDFNTVQVTVWNFVWLAITANLLVFSFLVYHNGLKTYFAMLLEHMPITALMCVGIMLLNFRGNLVINELRKTRSASELRIYTSSTMLVVLVVTLFINIAYPDLLLRIPTDPISLFRRFGGGMIILLSGLHLYRQVGSQTTRLQRRDLKI